MFILVEIIKDRNSPIGVNRTVGQVARPKEIGTNKVAGDNNSGEAVGKDMAKAKARMVRQQDTINMDTATVIGTAGINSITTTSIGVNNHRVGRLLQLAAKL